MLTVFALVALFAVPAGAADEIGVVTRVQNSAEVLSTGENRPLHAGDTVYADDVLSTGPESRLEVTFADGTNLTLGENAVIEIDEFVYDPDSESGSAVWDVIAGAFLMATGEIAKTSPENVSVMTPYAHIGIRGTEFWGGLIDDGYGVLALEGIVSVTTTGGTVVLSAVGEGTMIKAPGAAPTDPIIWGDEKKARAFDDVTFGP
jgi:hypothetical protein